MTRSARGAVVVDQGHGFFDQFFGEFFGVANGGRSQNEFWLTPIKMCNPFESADDIGNMRAEYSAIGVCFVDDDVFEICEEIRPVGVVRQNPGVKHVGVGEDDVGGFADCGTIFLRSITVVDCSNQ